MNYQISYEIGTISQLKENINTHGLELIDSLNVILDEINKLDKIYDTPTG